MKRLRLLVADVDGTLLTPDKVLTDRACQAVRKLKDAGIAFVITSGRPPLGLRMLIEPLQLTTPIAAFNGGMFVRPDLSLIEQRTIPPQVAPRVVALLKKHGLDVWVYRGVEWYIRTLDAPHVAHEAWTVKFEPKVVPGFDGLLDKVVKIVGVSDDHDAVERCEREAGELRGQISAARSQPYYLDVTHPEANKGTVVRHVSRLLSIPLGEIATIGDMPNDISMFRDSGLSIAMGNASEEVQKQADHVTSANTDEGFARAIDQWVIPAVGR